MSEGFGINKAYCFKLVFLLFEGKQINISSFGPGEILLCVFRETLWVSKMT